MEQFEKAVKCAMIEKGMKLNDLSMKLDKSPSFLSGIIHEQPSVVETRKRICEELELNYDDYFKE